MARPLTEAPEHLRLLADWFDQRDAQNPIPTDDEIQTDLRHWANQIERLADPGNNFDLACDHYPGPCPDG